jgi:hypothetical protein
VRTEITQFEMERWQRQFDINSQRLEQLRSSSGAVRPADGGWTAAECVEHLQITAVAFLPAWYRVQAQATPKPGKRYAFWWRWFLSSMRNPAKLRVRTPAPFRPTSSPELAIVLAKYFEQRDQILSLAMQTSKSQKGGYVVASPFVAWMKYPNDFSFDLWLAHEDRHLKQAERSQRGSDVRDRETKMQNGVKS